MKINSSTRRSFIKNVAVGATMATIVPRHVLGGPRHVPPSEKVNIALVGAGGMGDSNLQALFQEPDAQVIAVADPAASYEPTTRIYRDKKGGRLPARQRIEKHYSGKTPNYRCTDYEDFRVMLEKERSLDAVLCATPDHLHAAVSVLSMRAGKHVYCEKPLSNNMSEVRLIARVAKETGCATQMGNRGTSTPGIRETIELLRSGTIGTIREIHVWVPATRWNKSLVERPTETVAVPSDLNWDLWIGPRSMRPYHPCYTPVAWRDFWEFGAGSLGDFGCHDLNASVRAFNFQTPMRVEAHAAGIITPELAPHGSMVHYHFPAQGAEPARFLTWYDGGLRPRAPEAIGRFPMPRRGTLYIGDKGVVLTEGSGSPPRLFPDALRASRIKPAATLPPSNGHHRDWLDACKGGPPAGANFDYAARLTEIVLLGTLSLRLGRPIEWDREAMAVKGVPEAAEMIRTTHRQGWVL